jgi:peptidoglycan/xylan/chitin deacetylase (PgdA/CDA1 family)
MIKLLFVLLIPSIVLSGEISLSFDDAPKSSTIFQSRVERSKRLVSELKKVGVRRVAFYVNTKNIKNTEGKNILKMYQENGHLIGNHTHSHLKLEGNKLNSFITEIETADKLLRHFGADRRYFRFPYLNRGETHKKNKGILDYLNNKKYIDAYVTVDNFDWYMDHLFRQRVRKDKKLNLKKYKNLYIKVLWDSIQFYDNLAKNVLNRSPKHVLLLHENDLSSLFIGDLVMFLKTKGWTIVSPENSYKDPISAIKPKTLRNNNGRIAAIASEKGYSNESTVSKFESRESLEKLFVDL